MSLLTESDGTKDDLRLPTDDAPHQVPLFFHVLKIMLLLKILLKKQERKRKVIMFLESYKAHHHLFIR